MEGFKFVALRMLCFNRWP